MGRGVVSPRARCRCAGGALACALFAFRSGAAGAEEPGGTAPRAAAPAPESAPLAVDLFREAEARYTAGDVAGALDSMQRSYDLSGRPELLYNLGELRRELHQCTAASNAYGEYLARTPQGRYREEAERARAELRAECPEAGVAVHPPLVAALPGERAPAPAPAQPYWTAARVAGWSSVGAAGVTGTGALYFALRGQFEVGRFEGRVGARGSEGNAGAYTPDEQAIYEEGTRANTWTGVLGLSTVALAATGVALVVLNPGGREAPAGTVTLRVGPTTFVQTCF
jgi:hypothetical protein